MDVQLYGAGPLLHARLESRWIMFVCREDRVAVTLVAVRYSVTYSVWAGSMPGFEDVLSLERFFDFCGVGFSLNSTFAAAKFVARQRDDRKRRPR